MRKGLALLIILLVPSIAPAHHSRAEFRGVETVEIEGVLTKIIWRNPHIAMYLDVTTNTGDVKPYRIETHGGPWVFDQAGVSSEEFKVGDHLRVAGKPSTRRNTYFLGLNALQTDGTEVILGHDIPRHWNGPVLIGGTQNAKVFDEVVDASSENLGFFRVWSIEGGFSGRLMNFPFTTAAIAARADYDPLDSPISRCEPPGMPETMTMAAHFDLTAIDGETLRLRAPWFDTVRTIYMGDSLNSTDKPSTSLGFSAGHWEGDNTLIVETTNIDHPYMRGDGTPQSKAIKITERFTLTDDQTRLNYNMIVVDPVNLTGPGTLETNYVALNREYFAIECNIFAEDLAFPVN